MGQGGEGYYFNRHQVFKNIFLFVCLFHFGSAGLHCCTGFFLVVENRGYSLVAVRGFLISVTSLTAEHGL